MRRLARCPLLPLAALLGAGNAAADELPESPVVTVAPRPGSLQGGAVHGLEEFRFRAYQSQARLADFPDEAVFDYQEAVQRFSVSGGSSLLTAGLQVDGVALFSNQYVLDGELTEERVLWGEGLSGPHPNWWFGVEKFWLKGRGETLSWTLGDSYAAFGRGVALNVVKNTDIDVDTSLRGVHATVAAGDWEVSLVEAVANPQQVRLENPNVGMRADRPHAVHGVRVDRYGPVHVGAHAVAYQFVRALDGALEPLVAYAGDVDAGVVGATVEASGVGPFDLGAEFDWIGYGAHDLAVQHGYAGYVSASAYPGIASVLVEGKLYRDTEWLNQFASLDGYELSTGPSLEYERAITEDSSAALNSNDVVGARVRSDFALGKGGQVVTPYVSAAVLRDGDLGGVHFNTTPETIVHGVGGVIAVIGEFHVLANGGWRMDMRDDAPGSNAGDTTAHADLTVTIPLPHHLSVELAPSVLRYHWGHNPVQQTDYTDVSSTAALKIGVPWAVLVYADFSDNPLITSTGNVSENVYMAGELQWQPNSATTVKLFYGAYRAGIRCAGGQCRSLPGFEGARASLTSNF
ncbi:MAG: hypothetical protein EXR71_10280 [Myxococcales bacterium]|nr:hypothetical protein [Myxococcales bacterium]